MRNRDVELDLAETHYLTAIADLAPPDLTQEMEGHSSGECVSSPASTSSESDDSSILRRRPSDTSSLRSDNSVSTAATSISGDDQDTAVYKHKPKRSVTFADTSVSINDSTSSIKPAARPILSLINTRPTSPAPSWHEKKLSADLSAFVGMVKNHLAGVRSLKESHSSRNSPSNSRPASRNSTHRDSGMEGIRRQRRTLIFRSRFDPTSVQKLCAEALAEL